MSRLKAVAAAVALVLAAAVAARRFPARQDPEAATRLPRIATTGEPGKPPVAAGEEPSPGSAVATDNAARESDGGPPAPEAGDSYRRPSLGVLGPAPCNSPTDGGPCVLRLGHPLGPEMPGGGHLP